MDGISLGTIDGISLGTIDGVSLGTIDGTSLVAVDVSTMNLEVTAGIAMIEHTTVLVKRFMLVVTKKRPRLLSKMERLRRTKR